MVPVGNDLNAIQGMEEGIELVNNQHPIPPLPEAPVLEVHIPWTNRVLLVDQDCAKFTCMCAVTVIFFTALGLAIWADLRATGN